jgi:uroporphyrinogen decarboxylase
MNDRENAMAILNYQKYDRLPIVHFAFWEETALKWANEDHISIEEARDHNLIARKLGFDFDWFTTAQPVTGMNALFPAFTQDVVEVRPDGSYTVLDGYGVLILQKPDATGIPPELDHLLKDRKSWEEHFKPRLQFSKNRIDHQLLDTLKDVKDDHARTQPVGLYCGSLMGEIRNCLGVVGLSYIVVDDEALLDEIVETFGDLYYQIVEYSLAYGAKFDFGHFWEDICYKNGPLVSPVLFRRKIGPQYRRICDLLRRYGIDIVSLDCDGKIDALIPTWLENGVNTMFPIEVGVWDGNIKPWREKYGKQIRGVGGMDKKVFAYDYKAIDQEIERLKSLVDLGGFIPCPDHRIAPDAKWENVQYYCERMRKIFG